MDIQDYDLSNEKELEQLCKDAADGCYYPAKDQRSYAMALVIQNLVLPDHTSGFEQEAMANTIYSKLILRAAVRSVRDGRKK